MAEDRKVIFSFDDGPAPTGALGEILKILSSSNISAEFYVLGAEVKKYPAAARSIVAQGHTIQNHSWSHPNLATIAERRVFQEVSDTQEAIFQATQKRATRLRPPFGAGGWPGKFDPEISTVAKKLSLTIHNWDVDTEDWRSPRGIGPSKLEGIQKQIERKKKVNTLNVLMHVMNETARDLPQFIRFFKDLNFTFAKPEQ